MVPKLLLYFSLFALFLFIPGMIFCQNEKDLSQIIKELEKNPFTDSSVTLLNRINQSVSGKEDPEKKVKILLAFIEVYHAKNEYTKADSILDSLKNFIQTFRMNSFEPYYYLHKGKNDLLRLRVSGVVENYHKAFELFSLQQDTNGMVKTNVFLGEFYRKQEKFKLALNYLILAREMTKKCKVSPLIEVLMLNRLAAVFSEMANLDSSIYYSLMALKNAGESNLVHYEAISLNEIGYVLERLDDKKGISYYIEAENIWKTLGLDRYQANARLNRGRFLKKLGSVNESIVVLSELLTFVKDKEWPEISGPANEMLADIYYKKGEFRDAYNFLETGAKIQYDNLRKLHEDKAMEIDALFKSTENIKLLDQSRLETETVMKKLKEEQEANFKRLFIVILIGIIVITILFLYGFWKVRKKTTL